MIKLYDEFCRIMDCVLLLIKMQQMFEDYFRPTGHFGMPEPEAVERERSFECKVRERF